MKKKLSYFPPQRRCGGYDNPYSQKYQECLSLYYSVLDSKRRGLIRLMPVGMFFLYRSIKADIYIVNWLESICFSRGAFLQFLCAVIGLWIIKLRKKRIVWMFHNIHPHQGNNFMSEILQRMLYNYANLIISHSKEACIWAKSKARHNVIYRAHPIREINIDRTKVYKQDPCDVFIWGDILPYKGIVEFLKFLNESKSKLRIKIVGKCRDKVLNSAIKSQSTSLITYENRRASFTELAAIIKNSRYVLFPYIGDSVSSSGALIDTIFMGGNAIGPNLGAFRDLAFEKICIVYNNYTEMLSLLNESPYIKQVDIDKFFKENNWESFGKFLYEELKNKDDTFI